MKRVATAGALLVALSSIGAAQQTTSTLSVSSTSVLSSSSIKSTTSTGSTPATTSPQTLTPPQRRHTPGTRIRLTSSTLYVPDYFDHTRTSGTQLLLFFHGAAWVAEQNFYDARKNAVLLCVSMPMTAYVTTFQSTGTLDTLIKEAEGELAKANITSAPVTQICLSSFSAGYGAVREILSSGVRASQITNVVLADSLYAPRVSDDEYALVTTATQPFLDFAKQAAADGSTRRFIFSQLFPPEEKHRGNTTTLAAYYLTDALQVPRAPAEGENTRGAKLLYQAQKNGFLVLGYAGMTTQDHFEHFYAIGDLWQQTSLTDVPR